MVNRYFAQRIGSQFFQFCPKTALKRPDVGCYCHSSVHTFFEVISSKSDFSVLQVAGKKRHITCSVQICIPCFKVNMRLQPRVRQMKWLSSSLFSTFFLCGTMSPLQHCLKKHKEEISQN